MPDKKLNTGKVLSIRGSVVDARFPEQLPSSTVNYPPGPRAPLPSRWLPTSMPKWCAASP